MLDGRRITLVHDHIFINIFSHLPIVRTFNFLCHFEFWATSAVLILRDRNYDGISKHEGIRAIDSLDNWLSLIKEYGNSQSETSENM